VLLDSGPTPLTPTYLFGRYSLARVCHSKTGMRGVSQKVGSEKGVEKV